jgi:transcriptional regulator with XRE-family HTH domain
MSTFDIPLIIASRRRALKITQAELARRAGISRRTLIALENTPGASDIGFRKLERILNALGLSIAVAENPRRPNESELHSIFPEDD